MLETENEGCCKDGVKHDKSMASCLKETGTQAKPIFLAVSLQAGHLRGSKPSRCDPSWTYILQAGSLLCRPYLRVGFLPTQINECSRKESKHSLEGHFRRTR